MIADLILYNIGELVTSRELDNTKKQDNIEVIENGYIVIAKDKNSCCWKWRSSKRIFFSSNRNGRLNRKISYSWAC